MAKLDPRVTAAVQANATAPLDLVLTLDKPAASSSTAKLAGLGTWSWAFPHLPVAAVRVSPSRLDDVRRLGFVKGVYLDHALHYELKESAKAMDTSHAWNDLHVTGKGVTIAILDSGVDFNHPDLMPAMKDNVKLVEFGSPTPTVPVAAGPDSDTSSGHGTHVAGDAAGRGTQSGGELKGMGYGASLVGIGAGEGISIFTALEGFDWILANKDKDHIQVVNNSWGDDFRPWDPTEPINTATKQVTNAGIVVLFANGNGTDELSMNPYAQAPWVIPVAAGTKTGSVADFSSGGLSVDTIGTAFDKADVAGDPRKPGSLGLYHPAITSTGENVVSTRALATVVPLTGAPEDTSIPPNELPYYTTLSGTSMATPETSGVVALLLEANPALTPPQVRSVLEVSAQPISGAQFFREGYGYTDASRAVDLALALKGLPSSTVDAKLAALHDDRDKSVLEALAHPTHTLAFADPVGPPPVSVDHTLNVPAGTSRIKVVSMGPSTPEVNFADWTITVTDAKGQQVATGNDEGLILGIDISSGGATLDVDLHDTTKSAVKYEDLGWGTWKVNISSTTAPATPASPDFPVVGGIAPSLLYDVIAIFPQAATSCAPVPTFVPAGSQTYRLQDDGSGIGPFPPNTKYTYIGPVRNGSLGTRTPRYIAADWDVTTSAILTPAPIFTTAPLTAPLVVGQAASVTVYAQGAGGTGATGLLNGALLDVAPDGTPKTIATMPGSTPAAVGLTSPSKTTASIPIAKAYTIPAGHRLGVSVGTTWIGTTGDALFYDSDEFPSGVSVTTGSVQLKSVCELTAASAHGVGGLGAALAHAKGQLPATGGDGGRTWPWGAAGLGLAVLAGEAARRSRRAGGSVPAGRS
jgi:serine protease AprX